MKKFVVLWLAATCSLALFSQGKPTTKPMYLSYGPADGKNIIKFNLLGAAVRNYAFYGERMLSRKVSLIVGCNFMPRGGVPYLENFTDDETLKTLEVGTFSFTPELRFYLASGYGGGFYIGPYYRFERFSLYRLSTTFDADEEEHTIDLDGSLKTHNGGIVLGCQWLVGSRKNIVLDWSILGVHGGISSGNFNGLTQETISPQDQEEIKEDIEDALDIPIIKSEVTVNDQSAHVKIKGPWAFIRGSFSIGYRF